ncbi:MAG: TadE/TadG family type IV pilus assembly protein [Planctomycetota bacterium]
MVTGAVGRWGGVGFLKGVGKNMWKNTTHSDAGSEETSRDERLGFPPAGSEGGQAIAEFAFAFPLQLLIMFAIMQLAMMYVGKQVVTYASYSAARSAMVADATDRTGPEAADWAASFVCSPITGPSIAGSSISAGDVNDARIEVPGWGVLPNSGVSRALKTIISDYDEDDGEVEVTVTHYYELTFPLVDRIFAWIHRTSPEDIDSVRGAEGTSASSREINYEENVGIWNIDAPHIRLRATTRLAVPGG